MKRILDNIHFEQNLFIQSAKVFVKRGNVIEKRDN